MTTRSRGSNGFDYPYDYYSSATGETTAKIASCNLSPENFYETMSDEEPRFKRYGNCKHVRDDLNWTYTPLKYYYEDDGAYAIGSTVGPLYPHPSLAMKDVDWEQFNDEAFLTMKPTMGTDLNLSNFLLELKDVKQMFKLWDYSKSKLQNVAGGHLNWSFGWKPFIGDLQRLWETLSRTEERLRAYKALQGQVLTSHFKKTIWDPSYGETRIDSEPFKAYYTKAWIDCKFFATMRYSYSVPLIDGLYAQVRAWLDALGLKANLSVVWEAIPFSFVVDWFFNVSDVLRHIETDYLDSIVKVLDYCCTVKHQIRYEFWRGGDYSIYSVPTVLAASGQYTHYHRKRCLPGTDNFGLRFESKYGFKQVLLSAALLVA